MNNNTAFDAIKKLSLNHNKKCPFLPITTTDESLTVTDFNLCKLSNCMAFNNGVCQLMSVTDHSIKYPEMFNRYEDKDSL